jgi:hypothetical protein
MAAIIPLAPKDAYTFEMVAASNDEHNILLMCYGID